mgnify:CR=1 FL=1
MFLVCPKYIDRAGEIHYSSGAGPARAFSGTLQSDAVIIQWLLIWQENDSVQHSETRHRANGNRVHDHNDLKGNSSWLTTILLFREHSSQPLIAPLYRQN